MSNASPTSAPAGAKSAPLSDHRHPLAAVGASRWVAAASLLALILLGLAWELWLAPLRPGGTAWALKVLPLAAALPGLARYRMQTYRWLSLLVWLYFTEGVVRAFGDRAPSSWLAGLQVLLVLVLFAACAAHVRLRQRQARAAGLSAASSS